MLQTVQEVSILELLWSLLVVLSTTLVAHYKSRNILETWRLRMHCNLRSPDATPVIFRFNYNTHAKFEVTEPIHCRIIAFMLLKHYDLARFRCAILGGEVILPSDSQGCVRAQGDHGYTSCLFQSSDVLIII